MIKPRTGNIDFFCSKITQSNMKGLLKVLCEHECHTKYGSGSRSGHKRSRRSPNSKIRFWACGTCFQGSFARIIQKSKPFCNLTPRSQRKRRVRSTLGSHNVKFSNQYFWIKNMCFWTSFISGFQKCHFYYCPMSRNAPNHSLKKWRHQWIRFLVYMFAKNRHHPEIQHALCPGTGLQHIVRRF